MEGSEFLYRMVTLGAIEPYLYFHSLIVVRVLLLAPASFNPRSLKARLYALLAPRHPGILGFFYPLWRPIFAEGLYVAGRGSPRLGGLGNDLAASSTGTRWAVRTFALLEAQLECKQALEMWPGTPLLPKPSFS